jgi:hypothetical protein
MRRRAVEIWGSVRGRMTRSFMATIDIRYGVSCLHQLHDQQCTRLEWVNDLLYRIRRITVLSRYKSLFPHERRQKPCQTLEEEVEYQDSNSRIEQYVEKV